MPDPFETANRIAGFAPGTEQVQTKQVVVGVLSGNLPAFTSLRDTIDKVLLLMQPAEGKAS
jgi:hypothetical protein